MRDPLQRLALLQARLDGNGERVGEQLEQDDTERVHIGSHVVGAGRCLFGGHVTQCTERVVFRGFPIGRHRQRHATEAEIEQVWAPLRVDDDVVRLEVAMNHRAFVRLDDRLADSQEQPESRPTAQAVDVAIGVQVHAFDEGHRVVVGPLVQVWIPDGDDFGNDDLAGQLRRELHLVLEARQGPRPNHELGMQFFEHRQRVALHAPCLVSPRQTRRRQRLNNLVFRQEMTVLAPGVLSRHIAPLSAAPCATGAVPARPCSSPDPPLDKLGRPPAEMPLGCSLAALGVPKQHNARDLPGFLVRGRAALRGARARRPEPPKGDQSPQSQSRMTGLISRRNARTR
jgi:hypothetical protein